MKLLNKFNQSLGFTQTESRVILFLIFFFLVGIGIKVYRTTFNTESHYNYSALDSEFTVRSQLINNSDSLEKDISVNDTNSSSQRASVAPKKVGDSQTEKVNINSASKEELTKLPGIGEAMAERIILYRKENGQFNTIEDLMKVKGIGKKKFDKLTQYCIIGK